MMHDGVWCCEHKSKCKWQGFALHQGLSWGKAHRAGAEGGDVGKDN